MLSFYSSAFIFPFDVDRTRRKLEKFSGWKLKLWLWVNFLAVIYYLQGLVRFLSLLMFRREQVVLLHLPIQFDAMILPVLYYPVIILIYGFNSDLLAKVFNEMYYQDSSGCDPNQQRRRRKLRQLPAHEQLITQIGFMCGGGILFYGLLVLALNDMSHLLVNIEQLQFFKSSMIAVLFMTLLELWSFGMWTLKGVFLIQFNGLFLAKVESTLSKLSRDLR